MEIAYLGYASFRLKTKEGRVVLINPFENGFLGLKMTKQKADVVVVSEKGKGYDNVKTVDGAVKRESVFIIDQPGEYEVGGVEISMIQINGGEEEGKEIVVVRAEGLSVGYVGNLKKELKEKVKKQVGTVDVLLTAVGREGYLKAGERGALLKEINPSMVIPMEYQAKGEKNDDKELGSLEEFLEKNNMKVAENGVSKIKINKSNLPEDMQVVVLNVGN